MTGSTKLMTPSGGGVIIQPASSIASDVTVSVPSVSTTLVGTNTTQTLTNKTLTTPNFDSAQVASVAGTSPLYMCRAWVNFNGTGTVSIRASGNVSSITDNGTGNYTVNIATAMPDTNYAVTFGAPRFNPGNAVWVFQEDSNSARATTSFRLFTNQNAVSYDTEYVQIAVFR